MSGRRRKEMPPGGSPGDGDPRARSGQGGYGDRDPFAPRTDQQSGYDPPSPYGRPDDDRPSPAASEWERYGYSGPVSGGYGSTGQNGGYGQGGAGGHGAGGHGAGRPPAGGYGSTGRGHVPGGYDEGSRSDHGGSGHGGRGGRGRGRGGSGGGEGRRRAPRRRTLSTLLGPLAGAIGLAILLGAGVYALADSRGCGGGDAIALNVAAAPEIAPAIDDISNTFNRERHSVGGRCVKVSVKSADPAGTATVLSGQGSVPGLSDPDVWIPDSSLWVTLVHSSIKGATSVQLTPTSVARTPLVIATSRTFATKMHNQGIRPTWGTILKATDALSPGAVSKNDALPSGSVHLQILDPNRNAGGIGAVVMTRMLLQGDPNAVPLFTQVVRNVQNSVSPTPQALFASFHRDLHGQAPMVIVPEQAVWKYNKGHPAVPATALYPNEGLLSLDYPFALATDDSAKVRAAGLLEQAMSTPQAREAVHARGLRTPDGRPGDDVTAGLGLNPRVPRSLPPPATGDVTDVMEAWSKLSLRTRILTLLDVSGSMSQPVGTNGETRMQATAQIAQGGLGMLTDDTDVGLWTFSTNMRGPLDYQQVVPIGPLSTRLGSGTRRQAILSALGRVRPNPKGNTGLYDSVLASVRSVQRSYKVGYYNSVLVLTDGKNDDTSGISLTGLLRTLKKESDPDKPVTVVFIGFGPDVDMASMQRIAVETNGSAYHAQKPQEIQRILLETIAKRICAQPGCH